MRKAKHYTGKQAHQHRAHRTPPRAKRPDAIQYDFEAKARDDEHDAAEELKRQPAVRKKL